VQRKKNVLEQKLSPQQQQTLCNSAQLEQNKIHLQQQLIQTQQYAVLDKGLSAHLHQLGQFIQNYQTIEQQLGNPTLARQNYRKLKVNSNNSQLHSAQLNKVELKLEQQRKIKIRNLLKSRS
jgi:exonuclease SbcC